MFYSPNALPGANQQKETVSASTMTPLLHQLSSVSPCNGMHVHKGSKFCHLVPHALGLWYGKYCKCPLPQLVYHDKYDISMLDGVSTYRGSPKN